MKNLSKKLFIFVMVIVTAFTVTSCKSCKGGDDEDRTYYNNEEDALVFSSQAVDKVFNPFFSTTGPDSNVIGMTQIGMIGNDKEGNPTYGDNESVVTKDLQIVTEKDGSYTTYYFVLKNNVRFSNGSYLTIKDVLFNLYVYLDPVYTGSSTIYSTDIVGLKQYRTQEGNPDEQESFKDQFDTAARARITALVSASTEILKDLTLDEAGYLAKLAEYTTKSDSYKNVVKDYKQAIELFKKELESDYTNAIDSYSDITFSDESGKVFKNLITTDVEAFLYNEGYITWSKKEGKLSTSLSVYDVAELKKWSKEQAIEAILADKIPDDINEIVKYWGTSVELFNYISNEELENYYKDRTRTYSNIEGIKFANRKEAVTVNNKKYDVVQYDENGNVKEGYNEVLSIKIKEVDPKAIWNFAFGVAPMYYYSDQEHIDKFDFEENFGVEYGSPTFMNTVVKNPDRIGVPVGAGAYAASKSSGGITNIQPGEFYDKGVIYFERNPYYLMGTPTIKKVRFQVVAENQMLDTLYSKGIDFIEPSAKPDTIAELAGKANQGISYQTIKASGYGYIGINASKVVDLEVRQAIMHAINTDECVKYYKGTALPVYRSMSRASWAYPKDSVPYYPYIGSPVPSNEELKQVNPYYRDYVKNLGKKAGDTLTKEEQLQFIRDLVESAGYQLNANGIYQKGSKRVLQFTFTIAGQETDHPAYAALLHAKEILNEAGFQVEVKPDANALKKLSEGSLTVWAAAWGSTIDPDMYQVYHKESNATSVKNWGYNAIIQNNGGEYDEEVEILDYLSELIEKARKTNNQADRKSDYEKALTEVMKLAIELPTYQRDDLFVYNSEKIDVSTLTPQSELSPYKGLTSDLWRVSLYVKEK